MPRRIEGIPRNTIKVVNTNLIVPFSTELANDPTTEKMSVSEISALLFIVMSMGPAMTIPLPQIPETASDSMTSSA